MTKRKATAPNHGDASPTKSLIEDLGKLRQTLRKTVRAYTRRLDEEIIAIVEWTRQIGEESKGGQAHARDIGDMLTLVRKVDAKADKGRRKDLKKIDSVVSDLRFFVERKH